VIRSFPSLQGFPLQLHAVVENGFTCASSKSRNVTFSTNDVAVLRREQSNTISDDDARFPLLLSYGGFPSNKTSATGAFVSKAVDRVRSFGNKQRPSRRRRRRSRNIDVVVRARERHTHTHTHTRIRSGFCVATTRRPPRLAEIHKRIRKRNRR